MYILQRQAKGAVEEAPEKREGEEGGGGEGGGGEREGGRRLAVEENKKQLRTLSSQEVSLVHSITHSIRPPSPHVRCVCCWMPWS